MEKIIDLIGLILNTAIILYLISHIKEIESKENKSVNDSKNRLSGFQDRLKKIIYK